MGHRKYFVGLMQEEGLMVNGEWLFSIHKHKNGICDRYEYNIKTKELKMSRKRTKGSKFTFVDISVVQSNRVIDVSNSGMRCEGDCVKEIPFGCISLINESNELIYRGVMIGDRKECFGVEFYPGLDKIEYIGCYWNNQRHGYGMLYDRKGDLIYEGDFIRGLNDYEENAVVSNRNDSFHNLIHDLVIDEGCYNTIKSALELCGFKNLERIVVKTNSFKNVSSLKIANNPLLKSIEIMRGEYWRLDVKSHKAPFEKVKDAVIESMIDD